MRAAQIMCGGSPIGDLIDRVDSSVRTEADLLALERQHFLALMQMPLTQESLAHIRSTGRPLTN